MAVSGVTMHPLRELKCDEVLNNPALRTPPLLPVPPKPPRVRTPKVLKIPERFNLLDIEFYNKWVNHFKELLVLGYQVDDHPPQLFPELYLKPRRLNYYARQLEENMKVNKELLRKINYIQRTGGYVDCWQPPRTNKANKLLCKRRQLLLDEIRQQNRHIYGRLLVARSKQPFASELDAMWQETKQKLMLGSLQEFILFKQGRIDRDMKDPDMMRPMNVSRPKVSLDIRVKGGAKMGKVQVELFTDITPMTCELFYYLIKGDPRGYAYKRTRFFRIVPNLYCCGGDVCKDNGFGCYLPEGEQEPMGAENFILKHSIPGVLSMVVTDDNEVYGLFNIIFKPLPQFDGKHVVFGRIIAGPVQALERISAMGHPRGTTSADVIIFGCGYYSRTGIFREGASNTIKFPSSRKNK